MAKRAKAVKKRAQDAEGAGVDALRLLSADHREVEALFEQYHAASSASLKSQLARKVCISLSVHTMLEEQIFYPACRSAGVEHASLDEAQVEHDAFKRLVREIMRHRPRDRLYDAKVKVLGEYVKHHVNEEEKGGQGIFAKAGQAGLDMAALGSRLKARKARLMAEVGRAGLRSSAVRSLVGGAHAAAETAQTR